MNSSLIQRDRTIPVGQIDTSAEGTESLYAMSLSSHLILKSSIGRSSNKPVSPSEQPTFRVLLAALLLRISQHTRSRTIVAHWERH
jgi:hypothetical protein